MFFKVGCWRIPLACQRLIQSFLKSSPAAFELIIQNEWAPRHHPRICVLRCPAPPMKIYDHSCFRHTALCGFHTWPMRATKKLKHDKMHLCKLLCSLWSMSSTTAAVKKLRGNSYLHAITHMHFNWGSWNIKKHQEIRWMRNKRSEETSTHKDSATLCLKRRYLTSFALMAACRTSKVLLGCISALNTTDGNLTHAVAYVYNDGCRCSSTFHCTQHNGSVSSWASVKHSLPPNAEL